MTSLYTSDSGADLGAYPGFFGLLEPFEQEEWMAKERARLAAGAATLQAQLQPPAGATLGTLAGAATLRGAAALPAAAQPIDYSNAPVMGPPTAAQAAARDDAQWADYLGMWQDAPYVGPQEAARNDLNYANDVAAWQDAPPQDGSAAAPVFQGPLGPRPAANLREAGVATGAIRGDYGSALNLPAAISTFNLANLASLGLTGDPLSEQGLGNIGKGLEIATDPLTIAGFGLRGTGLAANLFGAGNLGAAKYGASTLAGSLAAPYGGDLAEEAGLPRVAGELGAGVLGAGAALAAPGVARGVTRNAASPAAREALTRLIGEETGGVRLPAPAPPPGDPRAELQAAVRAQNAAGGRIQVRNATAHIDKDGPLIITGKDAKGRSVKVQGTAERLARELQSDFYAPSTAATTPPVGAGAAPPPAAAVDAPLTDLERQMQASLRGRKPAATGSAAAPADLPATASVNDMRASLDAYGRNSAGTPSEVTGRYRGLRAELQGGIGTPSENVSNAARTRYEQVLEASGDPEAARLAGRQAAAQEQGANSRAVEMMKRLATDETGGVKLPENGEEWARTFVDEGPQRLGNELRQVTAGLDLSNALRQGWGTVRHGADYLSDMKTMARGLADEDFALNTNAVLKESNGAKAGLFIADLPGEGPAVIAKREESYAGSLIGDLPGFKQSGRANTLFLNKRRDSIFNIVEGAWNRSAEAIADGRAGPWQRAQGVLARPGDLEALANYINRTTGRGTLGPLEKTWVSDVLGIGLFSPRYQASRLQGPLQMFNVAHPLVAIEAIKDYAVSFAATAAVLALANESGLASVNLDPRSSDFGKVKVGNNTRIDPWAGYQQLVTLTARLISGEYEGGFDAEAGDLLTRFARGKLSPLVGRTVDITTGEDFMGRKYGLKDLPTAFLPIFAQGLLEASKDGLLGEAMMTLPASFFGLGTNTYPETLSRRQDRVAKEQYGKDFDSLDIIQQAEMNAQMAAKGIPVEGWDRARPYFGADDKVFNSLKAANSALNEYDTLADFRNALTERLDARGLRLQEAEAVRSKIEKELGLTDKLVQAEKLRVVAKDPGIVDALQKLFEDGELDDGPAKYLWEFVEGLKKLEGAVP